DSSYVMFDGCTNGISAVSSRLNVNGVKMVGNQTNPIERGIYGLNLRSNVNITNNRILTSRSGIMVNNIKGLGISNISDNMVVVDTLLDGVDASNRHGIFISNVSEPNHRIFVERNTVGIVSSHNFYGIGGSSL